MTDHERACWRDPALGTARDLPLPEGRLRAFESGDGEPLLFLHGLLVNANLWRAVVPPLAREARCICLDLPLGSHELALPAADLSGPGLADLVATAIAALGLERATVVGNDSGGAIAQMLVARRPEMVERLALTSCDSFDAYPPPAFRYLKPAAALPSPALGALLAPLRMRAARRLPLAYGRLTREPIERRAEDSYILPALRSRAIRDDARRAIRDGFEPAQTLAAAERFGDFERPVLIAWSREDRVFAPGHAERLRDAFPDARLEWIDGARTYSPEDRPEVVAELIGDFIRTGSTPAA